jgi:hypothetical protein
LNLSLKKIIPGREHDKGVSVILVDWKNGEVVER